MTEDLKPVKPPRTNAERKAWGRMKPVAYEAKPNWLMRAGSKLYDKITGR